MPAVPIDVVWVDVVGLEVDPVEYFITLRLVVVVNAVFRVVVPGLLPVKRVPPHIV